MNNTKISRRSFLAAAGIAGAAAALTACGSSASSTASSVAGSAAASSEAAGGSMELIVFAAASLTETLTAIGEIYSAENPGVTFSFNFDSSGTLKTQIQEGADCDLFISAGQKQMNQLDSTASADVNTEGLDFVDSDSRVDLLENKVVLCVPELRFSGRAPQGRGHSVLHGQQRCARGPVHPEDPCLLRFGRGSTGRSRCHHLRLQRQGGHHPDHRSQRGCRCRVLHRCLQRRPDPRG